MSEDNTLVKLHSVVSFHYRLSENGDELESSFKGDPVLSLMGKNNMIPGLETALLGKQRGEKFSVEIPPEDGYGLRVERDPQRVPIKHLANKVKKIKKGQIVHVNSDQGTRQATVVKVGKFNVDVDTNHPFAGKTLSFDIEIVALRDATQEEISHGHAHGIGGHQH